jgi:hypothetical protein
MVCVYRSIELAMGQRLDLFGLPEDLRGKGVLNIGAWDGWLSSECKRCGADVVAVDCVELDTSLTAKRLLDSTCCYSECCIPCDTLCSAWTKWSSCRRISR